MMTTSYTMSEAVTFTVTHAKHMAAKVATDLKRIQRFYGAPDDIRIAAYELELTLLIREGYLAEVTYGFQRAGAWIEPTLRYKARDLAGTSSDDHDPGRVRPGADTTGASFGSFLAFSSAWTQVSPATKDSFKRQLPFQRVDASEPSVNGYLQSDRIYSAGGRALDRASVKNF